MLLKSHRITCIILLNVVLATAVVVQLTMTARLVKQEREDSKEIMRIWAGRRVLQDSLHDDDPVERALEEDDSDESTPLSPNPVQIELKTLEKSPSVSRAMV